MPSSHVNYADQAMWWDPCLKSITGYLTYSGEQTKTGWLKTVLVLAEIGRSLPKICHSNNLWCLCGSRPEELKFLHSYLLIWGSSALPEIGAMSTGITAAVDSQYE